MQLQAAKDREHVVILGLEDSGSIASWLMNAGDLQNQ
jgi:hypothetical protein